MASGPPYKAASGSLMAYDGFIFKIIWWDRGQCCLESETRRQEIAHVVEWQDDETMFMCSCEFKEFGAPRCKHEKFTKAVLEEKKCGQQL